MTKDQLESQISPNSSRLDECIGIIANQQQEIKPKKQFDWLWISLNSSTSQVEQSNKIKGIIAKNTTVKDGMTSTMIVNIFDVC